MTRKSDELIDRVNKEKDTIMESTKKIYKLLEDDQCKPSHIRTEAVVVANALSKIGTITQHTKECAEMAESFMYVVNGLSENYEITKQAIILWLSKFCSLTVYIKPNRKFSIKNLKFNIGINFDK